jgi:hypothetical protein
MENDFILPFHIWFRYSLKEKQIFPLKPNKLLREELELGPEHMP